MMEDAVAGRRARNALGEAGLRGWGLRWGFRWPAGEETEKPSRKPLPFACGEGTLLLN